MAHASAYSLTKAAIVTRLNTRPALADVAISYQAPVRAEDVRGRGNYEAIFCDEAEGGFSNVVLCAGHLRFDETYTQQVVIEVERPDSLGTQQAADQRAEELLYEVHAELSEQDAWNMADLGLNVFEYFQVTPVSQRWVTGFLPSGAGHAARCELGLLVEARRSFT